MSTLKRPKLKDNPNLTKLLAEAESYMRSLEDGSHHCDNDDQQYIVEAVMESLYGNNIYDTYINPRMAELD